VAHVHYEGLSQPPVPGVEADHAGVKALGIPVFMLNKSGTALYEIGRQGGIYEYRNDSKDPLGKWKFYAK
jgi:hypothetical protein